MSTKKTYKDYKAGNITKDQALSHFGNKALDTTQTSLDAAGLYPALGVIPDLTNVGISHLRAMNTDDPELKRKHNLNKKLSLGAAIPGMGLGIGGAKFVMKNAPELATNIKNISSNIKYHPGYEITKPGTKVYKADQKGHVTGEEGELTDLVNQNIVDPAIEKAGPGGILKNLYNKYIKNDSNQQIMYPPPSESDKIAPIT